MNFFPNMPYQDGGMMPVNPMTDINTIFNKFNVLFLFKSSRRSPKSPARSHTRRRPSTKNTLPPPLPPGGRCAAVCPMHYRGKAKAKQAEISRIFVRFYLDRYVCSIYNHFRTFVLIRWNRRSGVSDEGGTDDERYDFILCGGRRVRRNGIFDAHCGVARHAAPRAAPPRFAVLRRRHGAVLRGAEAGSGAPRGMIPGS